MSGLQGSLEENTLTLLGWSADYADAVRQRVKPEDFSAPPYQSIARAAIGFIDQYHEPAGPHLRDLLEDELRPASGSIIETALVQMERLAGQANCDFMYKSLDAFLADKAFDRAVVEAQEIKQQHGVEAGLAKLDELRPEIERHLRPADVVPDANDLMKEELPEVRWIVPGYIPEGSTVLAGPPKVGKTWLLLNLGLGCRRRLTVFGEQARKTEVLMLLLEDNKRRLRRRLGTLLSGREEDISGLRYLFAHDGVPDLDNNLIGYLKGRLRLYPRTGAIFIDTLARVKGQPKPREQPYAHDVRALSALSTLAEECHVAVIVTWHTRKTKGDAMEIVGGTYGLTGSVDTVISLTREPAKRQGRMRGDGRDVEEPYDKLVEFDKDKGFWRVVDDYEEASTEKRSTLHDNILKALGASRTTDGRLEPMQVPALAQAVGKKDRAPVDTALWKMSHEKPSPVWSPSRGWWTLSQEHSPYNGDAREAGKNE